MIDFVRLQPLRKIHGIGPVSEATLKGIGFNVVEDLWQNRALLARIVSKRSLYDYMDISLGFPSSTFEVDEEYARKSIGTERTLGAEGVDGIPQTLQLAREICVRLAEDIQKTPGLAGKTVTLVLKGVDFQRRSKSISVDRPISTAEELWPIVKNLVQAFQPTVGAFRLIGLRLSRLTE